MTLKDLILKNPGCYLKKQAYLRARIFVYSAMDEPLGIDITRGAHKGEKQLNWSNDEALNALAEIAGVKIVGMEGWE